MSFAWTKSPWSNLLFFAGEEEGGAPAADPAPVEGGTPEAEPVAADPAPASEAPPVVEDPRPKEDWRDKRIAKLTAQKAELEARAVELAKRVVPPAPATDAEPRVEPIPVDPDDFNRKVTWQAEQLRFNEKCNELAQKGDAKYPDFTKVIADVNTKLGTLNRDFLEATFETDDPIEVLYALGKDLNKANEILSLPPIKQAVAIARYADKLLAPKAKPTVSKAPAPIEPVVGRGGKAEPNLDDPDLPMAEWMSLRKKQLGRA